GPAGEGHRRCICRRRHRAEDPRQAPRWNFHARFPRQKSLPGASFRHAGANYFERPVRASRCGLLCRKVSKLASRSLTTLTVFILEFHYRFNSVLVDLTLSRVLTGQKLQNQQRKECAYAQQPAPANRLFGFVLVVGFGAPRRDFYRRGLQEIAMKQ